MKQMAHSACEIKIRRLEYQFNFISTGNNLRLDGWRRIPKFIAGFLETMMVSFISPEDVEPIDLYSNFD